MGRLERHIDPEALRRALAAIEARKAGKPIASKPQPRPRGHWPRAADTYRGAWRAEGRRAAGHTKYEPVRAKGRAYPYASAKRGGA